MSFIWFGNKYKQTNNAYPLRQAEGIEIDLILAHIP